VAALIATIVYALSLQTEDVCFLFTKITYLRTKDKKPEESNYKTV